MSARHRWWPSALSQSLPLAPSSPMTLNIFNQYWRLMSEMSVKIAVILTKIIFLCAKKKQHMHTFNMLLIAVQSFKMNAWKPWEELITQVKPPCPKPVLTPCPILTHDPQHIQSILETNVKVKIAVILSKIIFLCVKNTCTSSICF